MGLAQRRRCRINLDVSNRDRSLPIQRFITLQALGELAMGKMVFLAALCTCREHYQTRPTYWFGLYSLVICSTNVCSSWQACMSIIWEPRTDICILCYCLGGCLEHQNFVIELL
ncbi:hypothetical protein SEVIR_9G577500v4 [Setaria viridis]